MRLLLDTNVLVWGLNDTSRIRPAVHEVMSAHENWVSHVSVWEIAVKEANGKTLVDLDVPEWLSTSGLNQLPISLEHVWRVRTLPLLHRNPFDRLLVAQAMVEGMTLVTGDRHLAAYGIPVIQV